MAAAAMDINDVEARQWGKRGEHNNQIKVMVVKMAFDCNRVGSEDGV
jgi:hypothetical protein